MSDSDEMTPWSGDEQGVRVGGQRFPWDEVVDVVVLGFGAAGASAAIEATTRGAKVLVADRFEGGGASRLSAGVVYFGGGTRLQQAAGYEDSAEDMYRYLVQETRDVVSEETLRAFCARSVENFEWLSGMGVPFPARGEALKTSYPPDDCTLYFSGNELSRPYADQARPVPRGHRALGKGLTGHVIFSGLQRRASELSVDLRKGCRAERLVLDAAGSVLGVVLVELAPMQKLLHEVMGKTVTYGGSFSSDATTWLRKALLRMEAKFTRRRFVRARGGVVLSMGGFVYNPDMMRQHAPAYADCSMRLGTSGDDGSGIRMGVAVGARTNHLERCCAWRFINPPSAWLQGILVGRNGQRVCNEELYGSTLGEHLAEGFQGRAHLVLDHESMELARKQMHTEPMGGFQIVFGTLNNYVNYKRAPSLDALAHKCGLPPDALEATVQKYNQGVEAGEDAMLKKPEHLKPMLQGPFYAIDCDLSNLAFPTPCITLGGLVVDGLSARVVREDNAVIPGLYAAGRNAVGISSFSYVSGLSVADGLFSGRNAGAHAAGRAQGMA